MSGVEQAREHAKLLRARADALAAYGQAVTVGMLRAAADSLDALADENERLEDAVASALTSLATGPLKDGYAYAVLDGVLAGAADTPDEPRETCCTTSLSPAVACQKCGYLRAAV